MGKTNWDSYNSHTDDVEGFQSGQAPNLPSFSPVGHLMRFREVQKAGNKNQKVVTSLAAIEGGAWLEGGRWELLVVKNMFIIAFDRCVHTRVCVSENYSFLI